jgi:hypothetical protein
VIQNVSRLLCIPLLYNTVGYLITGSINLFGGSLLFWDVIYPNLDITEGSLHTVRLRVIPRGTPRALWRSLPSRMRCYSLDCDPDVRAETAFYGRDHGEGVGPPCNTLSKHARYYLIFFLEHPASSVLQASATITLLLVEASIPSSSMAQLLSLLSALYFLSTFSSALPLGTVKRGR